MLHLHTLRFAAAHPAFSGNKPTASHTAPHFAASADTVQFGEKLNKYGYSDVAWNNLSEDARKRIIQLDKALD